MNTKLSPVTPRDVELAAHVKNAVKVFGKGNTRVCALNGVDLALKRGCFTAIMGPSGSGKSTLMHCMAGLDKLSQGDAWIGEHSLANLNDTALAKLRRQNVGFVFQAFNLIPTLTARENIELPLRLDGKTVDPDWMNQVTARLHLTDRLNHTPAELSGGQQQRVAVARALVTRPSVIFADEPTGNLDSASGTDVLNLLRSAVDDFGQTIVMVTHDPNAACVADRVLFLVDGRIVRTLEDPTADSVFEMLRDVSAGSDPRS